MGNIHANAWCALKDMKIALVCDIDPVRGHAFASKFDCEYIGSPAALAGRKIDIADICLPTYLHFGVIEEISAFCKNIICENPLALSVREAQTICRIIKERGVRLMVAHVLRFWDVYVKAREVFKSGTLGKINSITCQRRQRMSAGESPPWGLEPGLSGGIAFDLMIHDIDYILWLMGEPESVFATVCRGAGGEYLHEKAYLVYENCTAQFFASSGMPRGFENGGLRAETEIIGDRAMLAFDNFGRFEITDEYGLHRISVQKNEPYALELSYFANCVKEQKEPKISTAETAGIAIGVLEAIGQSIKTENAVRMENIK